MYHERQQRMLCGLHAVNNLLQGPVYTKAAFDNIAYELAADPGTAVRRRFLPRALRLNPHKLPWVGDYDANVLISALAVQHFDVLWHNRQQGIDALRARLEAPQTHGVIVNVPETTCHMRSHHWFAVRKFPPGQWVLLDSKLEQPVTYPSLDVLLAHFVDWLDSGAEVLVIVPAAPG